MSTNANNFSGGPETPKIIGLPSRFADFQKGYKTLEFEAGYFGV